MTSSTFNEQASDILADALGQVATAGISAVSGEIERRVEEQEAEAKSILQKVVVGALVVIGGTVVAAWVLERVRGLGTTCEEVASEMAADDVVDGEFSESMVAVTLDFPPSQVWERIGQVVGERLSGSPVPVSTVSRVANLGVVGAEAVDIATLRPDDTVFRNEDGSSVVVTAIDPGRVLALAKSDETASWSIRLEANPEGGTRLVSRRRMASSTSSERALNLLLQPARGLSDLVALLELNSDVKETSGETDPLNAG